MDLDFTDVQQPRDFVTIPEGTYVCRVTEVVPGVTRGGHDRWGLRLVVAEGEYVGRQAAWDGLMFTERGMHRTRRVFAALGLPAEGKVAVEPDDVVGRHALVTIRPGSYRDPVTDEETRRNEVPYDGYRPVPEDTEPPPPADHGMPDDDAIPF